MAIVTIENLIFDHGNLRSRVYQYWRKLHRCQVTLDISGSSIKSQCGPRNIFPGATFKVNGAPGISFQEPHSKSMAPPKYHSRSPIKSQWSSQNIFPGATFKVNGAPGISFQEPHLKKMALPEYHSRSYIKSQWRSWKYLSRSHIQSQCRPQNIFPGATFKVNGSPGISFQEPHLKSVALPKYHSRSYIKSQWHSWKYLSRSPIKVNEARGNIQGNLTALELGCVLGQEPLDLYSLSRKTSYRKISRSLEVARFRFRLFQLL